MQINIVQGSILDAEAEVIVNAANSLGLMGGGVAGVIKRAAGAEVEREAVKDAPIRVGKAVLTSGGKTKFKGIIHAPTMPEPGMHIPAQNVALATKAALILADEKGFESIAIPGMGTGVGGVAHADAAKAMMETVRAFPPRTLKSVILVDVDHAMVEAWRDCLADSK
jgi:O-acetyl-ADP-ribose deacetylase (regulator of RNase III)